MPTLADKMINAMEPRVAIRIESLTGNSISKNVLSTVYNCIKYSYETMIDKEHKVIYIGRKV